MKDNKNKKDKRGDASNMEGKDHLHGNTNKVGCEKAKIECCYAKCNENFTHKPQGCRMKEELKSEKNNNH